MGRPGLDPLLAMVKIDMLTECTVYSPGASSANTCKSSGMQSNTAATVIVQLTVTLSMSQAQFWSIEAQYIASVALTAEVNIANVEVVSVTEHAVRSIKYSKPQVVVKLQMLSTSVQVRTQITTTADKSTNMGNADLLNANLALYGLPPAVVAYGFQSLTSPVASLTTPIQANSSLPTSGAGNSPNFPIYGIIGGCIAGAVFVFCIVIGWIFRSSFGNKPALTESRLENLATSTSQSGTQVARHCAIFWATFRED